MSKHKHGRQATSHIRAARKKRTKRGDKEAAN